MKNVCIVILALALCLTLVACGGASTPAASSTPTVFTAPPASIPAESASVNTTFLDQYSDTLTLCYRGVTSADEAAVFCADADITFAILSILNPETSESTSFMGSVTQAENDWLTITDEAAGLALTFEVINNGDGTFTLDMGDAGMCTVTACTQAQAFEALATSDAYSTRVV